MERGEHNEAIRAILLYSLAEVELADGNANTAADRAGGVSAVGGRQGYTGGVRVVQFGSLRRGRSKMAWNDTTSSTAEVVV